MEGCEPHVHGYARGGGRIVTLRAAAAGAPELYAEQAPGGRRRLTSVGTAWQRPLGGISSEDVSVPGPTGAIRATLVSPRGAGRKPLPLVLSVIGGPGSSWGPEPWLPDRMLAAAGARGLMPDPRGSASYGRDWLEAILGEWGGPDAEDQLACVTGRREGSPIPAPGRSGLCGLADAPADRRPSARAAGRQRRPTRSPPPPTATRAPLDDAPRLGRPPAPSERRRQLAGSMPSASPRPR
jgi:dipeptidyl aminopeptidase/acylaminoacyl peptidase